MPSPSKRKPKVGNIVMFVPERNSPENHNGAEVVPAIVVRTWENTSYENDEINLKVLTDGPTDTWRTSIPHSKDKEPNTWHWSEELNAELPDDYRMD